jgi:hypothetical protein
MAATSESNARGSSMSKSATVTPSSNSIACTSRGGRVPSKAFAVHAEGVFIALPRFGFGNVLVLHHHRIPRLEDGLNQLLFPIVVKLVIQLSQTCLGLLDAGGGCHKADL